MPVGVVVCIVSLKDTNITPLLFDFSINSIRSFVFLANLLILSTTNLSSLLV